LLLAATLPIVCELHSCGL